jgi:hypothetical protein
MGLNDRLVSKYLGYVELKDDKSEISGTTVKWVNNAGSQLNGLWLNGSRGWG